MHKIAFRYFLLWLFPVMAGCVSAMAQLPDFNVQMLGEADGIRTSNILKMVRDKQGFLWLLSPRYIQRFDGQNLKRFDTKGEDLLDIVSDHDGKIWVSTQTGVQTYINDYLGFQKVEMTDAMPTKFNVMQVSHDNKVWVISGKGLFVYDISKKAFVRHVISGLEKQLFYRKIFQKSGDEYFVGDTHTLFSYNLKTGRRRTITFDAVTTIVPFSEDIIWATNAGLQVFEINFKTGVTTPIQYSAFTPTLASGFLEINAIVPLSGDQFLVSTTQGCYKYDRSERKFSRATFYHFGREIPNNEITTTYFDQEGILWMLGQQGIIFFRPRQHTISWLRTYSEHGGEGNNNIKAVSGDDSGHIWLGNSAGLAMLDTQTGKVKSFHPNNSGAFQFPSVQGLAFDGKNLIVGPGAGGPLIFNPKKYDFKSPSYPAGSEGLALKQRVGRDYIYGILPLASGEHLILGDESCYVLEKDTYKLREADYVGSNFISQCAVQEKSGNVWIGTFRGLVFLDQNLQTVAIDSVFGPSRFISSLLSRNDSVVWAGTVGLYEVTRKGRTLHKKSILPELGNMQITMLYRDKNDKIWIGADDGLYRYSETDKKLEWFDIWDNVQNKQLNSGSIYETKNGTLYLGGNNGLNYFDPLKIEPRRQNLNVMITGVTINQDDSLYLIHRYKSNTAEGRVKSRSDDNRLVLDWHQNSVEIQFVTTYFQNTQKIKYRYRLAGLDTAWVLNGRNNSVRFSSLAPGNYSFSVAASLDGIVWQQMREPFRFSISPPFWKRAWFIILAILVTGGLTYYLFRRRISSIRQQQAEVFLLQSKANALEKEKALAMYEGLKQQLNPHFLFNSLTSLDSLIFIDQKLASQFLERLSKIYRYILKNRDNEVVTLKDEMQFAREYINLQKARFEDGLLVNLHIEPHSEDKKVAPVTMQNLIENAIKHNIIAEDTPLVIDIFTENGLLIVRNSLNKKNFVETSNKQGLKNLRSLYRYLSDIPILITEEGGYFMVKIPLL